MSKDRRDAKYVKGMDSMHAILPHLMNNRCDAEVYSLEEVDITELYKYLEKLNKTQDYKTTMFHAVITALAKTIYNRPLMNRYIAGKRYYDRKKVTFAFTAKTKFEDNAEERLLVFDMKKDMNIKNISKEIHDEVAKTRKSGSNDMNDTLGFVTKWPRFIVSFIMWAFRKMDYHDLVPMSIMKTDPNYATTFVTNLGSIKCNACYHHLNNYGTSSMMIAIGEYKDVNYIDEKGKVKTKKVMDMGFTLDERIADGFYFAKSIKLFKYIIAHPELLEDDLEKEVKYEEK